MTRVAVRGSAPDHTGYRWQSAADPSFPVRASIILRAADASVATALLSGTYDPRTRAAPATGASAEAVQAVEAFARREGLTVEEANAATRTVVMAGPAEQVGKAFQVHLGWFVSPDGSRYLSYEGELTVSPEIAPFVLAVLGLDMRPVARAR